MNLDFSQITAFALEGSCTPDAQVIGGSTLTLQPGVRSKGERSAPSNAKIMTCRGGKPGPLRTAVTTPSSKGADLTLTFHC